MVERWLSELMGYAQKTRAIEFTRDHKRPSSSRKNIVVFLALTQEQIRIKV
jgi:hypothetical protein